MTGPSFVDANVFLYTQDRRDLAKHRRAEQWLDSLWRSSLGRTSIQALSEFYAVSTRKFGVPPLEDGAVFGAVTVRSPA